MLKDVGNKQSKTKHLKTDRLYNTQSEPLYEQWTLVNESVSALVH